MDASFRQLRIIWAALLVSVVLYVVVAEKTGPREPKDVRQFQMLLMVLAAGLVGTILVFRQRLLAPAEEVLRTQPEDAAALGRWRSANIVTLALSEGVVLYGLVLRFRGGTLRQAAAFYAAGVLLMLVFAPRRPE